MSKGWKVTIIVVAAILLVGTVGSATIAALSLSKLSAMEAAQEKANEPEETQEDDVVIADSYTIESTLQISDAYKSGDTSKLSDRDKETLDMASEVLDEIITDGMSDYEKELAVYQWMTGDLQQDAGLLTVIPTTGADSDNPYGVLKYHQAVCVGYATTFRLFMQMMDIDCMVVHNTEKYHSWDLVKLDDHWYHTDIYSDASTSDYSHFNLNDALQSQNESWDTSFYPAADSLTYNMAIQNCVEVDDIYGIPEQIRTLIDNGGGVIGIKPAEAMDEEKAEIVETMMSSIENNLAMLSNSYYISSRNWVQDDNDNYIYVVNINSYDGGTTDTTELDDETTEKVLQSLNDAFDGLLTFESLGYNAYDEVYSCDNICG